MLVSRRHVLKGLSAPIVAGIALPFIPRRAKAQNAGSVTVSSYGGRYQDTLRKAIFEPFEKETGIKVVEASGINISKVRAMVMANTVDVDVVNLVPSEFFVLAEQGNLEKIDYSAIDKTILSQLDPQSLDPAGVGFVYYSQVVAWSTAKFNEKNHPRSWADVWNVSAFPGRRVLPAGDFIITPIEAALIADGVAPDHLYPLDFDRAYKSLAKIRPAVPKWANSSSAMPQALVDKEADLGLAAVARIIELRDQGAAVDFDWNQGLLSHDYFAVPKGAKNFKNAMKFIEFASRADVGAAVMKLMAFSANNQEAFKLLTADETARMPSFPANREKQILLDPKWWSQKNQQGATYVEYNIRRWGQWVTAG